MPQPIIDHGKLAKTKILNRIIVCLILTSIVLVLSCLSIWVVKKDAESRRRQNLNAEKRIQKRPYGRTGMDVEGCDELEYRFKHFRLLKRRQRATIYFLNGDRYYGDVSENKLRINAVSRYVGIGVEGERRPDGWGEMEYTTGSQYTGQWAKGVREGCGVIVTKGYLSTRYSGAWKQDKQTGYGEMIYSNGAWFHGQWVNNLYHGQGELKWANGDAYKGEFMYGSMHGQGVFTYSDGSRYSGVWSQGQSTGMGRLLTAKGSCLEIIWKNLQPQVYSGDNCTDLDSK